MRSLVTVNVKLFATLRECYPGARTGVPIQVRLEDGATVGMLVQRLGIPKEAVRVVFVNGVVVNDASPLRDGDDVGFFPAIAGGA